MIRHVPAVRLYGGLAAIVIGSALLGCAESVGVHADDHDHEHAHEHQHEHDHRAANLFEGIVGCEHEIAALRKSVERGDGAQTAAELDHLGGHLSQLPDLAAETHMPKPEWNEFQRRSEDIEAKLLEIPTLAPDRAAAVLDAIDAELSSLRDVANRYRQESGDDAVDSPPQSDASTPSELQTNAGTASGAKP